MPALEFHVLNCPYARERFIEALAAHGSVRGALRATGEACTYVYRARQLYPWFAEMWDARVPPGAAWRRLPRASAKAGWRDRIIEGLARTGNQRRAARIAGVSRQLVEQERRRNYVFAMMHYEARHDGRIGVLMARCARNERDFDTAIRVIEVGASEFQGVRIRPRRDEPEPEPHPLCPPATLRVPPPGKGRPGRRPG